MARRNGGFVGQDGLDAPDIPTGVAGTGGDTQVSVAFNAPTDAGTSAITGFNVQLNDGSGTFNTFSTTVATGNSFDPSNEVTTNGGFIFSNDGTKVFILDINEVIYQYDLSAAFDISTMSYNNVTLDPGSQIPANQGIYSFAISADGTKVYIMSYYADVYQYTLSTAFALNTASYANKTHDFKHSGSGYAQDFISLAYGLEISNDGTRVYISHAGSDNIFEYILSTAHDISTAGDVNHTFSIASNTVGHGLTFNSDGTELYSMANAAVEIFKYTLTTAFDLSTASFSDSVDVSGTGAAYYSAVGINADATKFYVGLYQGDYFEYKSASYPSSSPIVLTGLTDGTNHTANVWAINAYGTSAPSAASASFTSSARGLFLGGGNRTNVIQYISISSTGDAADFGDLTVGLSFVAGLASSTRGVAGGGLKSSDPPIVNSIDYVTIASTGNAADFGNLAAVTASMGACSNSTRGVFAGGGTSSDATLNVLQYITIASTGNTTDFGDILASREGLSGCGSPTRGIFWGGRYISNSSYVYQDVIQYITIGTTGDATDFGNLTSAVGFTGSVSSSTRAVRGGGGFNRVNTIDYVTIASTGNATDFGDLLAVNVFLAGASGSIRGVFGGGNTGSDTDVMQYITIASTGNATDFGDLAAAQTQIGACSNGHGGL